jgi:hypothetical protein
VRAHDRCKRSTGDVHAFDIALQGIINKLITRNDTIDNSSEALYKYFEKNTQVLDVVMGTRIFVEGLNTSAFVHHYTSPVGLRTRFKLLSSSVSLEAKDLALSTRVCCDLRCAAIENSWTLTSPTMYANSRKPA